MKDALKQRERVFRNEYGTRAFALEYYQKALHAAKNDEFAAEMLAMSQKCLVNPTMTSISQAHALPVMTENYFRPLRERYAKTEFHQRLIEECATYRDYARQR